MAKNHTVQRGETIIQIAQQYGFRAWEPIWLCDQNAALRQQRSSPHLLAKGDTLVIPDLVPIDHSCATNLRHTFRVPVLTQHFQQTVLDENGQPLSGLAYELSAGGKSFKGKTGADGTLQHEIPLHAKSGELKVWLTSNESPIVWKVRIGHLEPVTTVYGLKGRLANLGFDCDADNDAMDEKTTNAIRLFQSAHGLPVTGQPDPDTLAKLEEIHDHSLR